MLESGLGQVVGRSPHVVGDVLLVGRAGAPPGISEGGLAVLSETPIPVGKIFTINSPLLKEILQMEDIPVRITHSICDRIDRPCRLGAEFVGLPESARKKMRQYIFKKETERVRVK